MSGVEVWAHAIETELEEGGMEEVGKGWLILTDVVIALLILWLHHFIGGRAAFLTYILIVPLSLMIASFVIFRATALFLNFAPVAVAIFVHQLYDDFLQSKRAAQH